MISETIHADEVKKFLLEQRKAKFKSCQAFATALQAAGDNPTTLKKSPSYTYIAKLESGERSWLMVNESLLYVVKDVLDIDDDTWQEKTGLITPENRKKPRWGVRLSDRRARLGLTMQGLEDAVKDDRIYVQFINRLENGHIHPSSIKTDRLELLASGLKLTPQELAEMLEIVLPKRYSGDHMSLSGDEVTVRELDTAYNEYVDKIIPVQDLPHNSLPSNIILVSVDDTLYVSLNLKAKIETHNQLQFDDSLEVKPNSVLLVYDEETQIYAVINAADRVVVKLDQSDTVKLKAPDIRAVLKRGITHYE